MMQDDKAGDERKKVVMWVVDPFDLDVKRNQTALSVIQALAKRSPFEVEPVYLWNPYALNTPVLVPHEMIDDIQASAQDELDKLLSQDVKVQVRPLAVLSEPVFTESLVAEELMSYAENKNADFLVISPRYEQWPRMSVGPSLADTVAFHSRVPVILVTPSNRTYTEFDQIVLCEEWVQSRHEVIHQIMSLASEIGCEVTILREVEEGMKSAVEGNLNARPGFVVLPAPKKNLMAGRGERNRARKIIQSTSFPVCIIPDRSSKASSKSDDLFSLSEQDVLGQLRSPPKDPRVA